MNYKGNSSHNLQNLCIYTENVKKRDLKPLILPRIPSKNLRRISEKSYNNGKNPLTKENLSQEETNFLSFIDISEPFSLESHNYLDKSKETAIKPKKYLDLLREIEEKAEEKYEKMKEKKRAKSIVFSNKFPENQRGFKLKSVREINENNEELENIDDILMKKEDFLEDNGYRYWDLDKIKGKIKEKINKELMVPITDYSKFNKENKGKNIKKEDLVILKKNKKLDPGIEEILGRERMFYVKKLKEFYRMNKINC